MTAWHTEEVDNLMRGFVLEHIEKFKKANPKAVIGKIIAAFPNTKAHIPEVLKELEKIIKEYEKVSAKEFKDLHAKYTAHIKTPEKKKKEKGLPELEEVDKKYALRFAPSPSGALHVGHSFPLLINSEYAKKYKGKFILRIEDTNPTNIYPEAYQLIEEDAQWITENNVAELIIQSDRVDLYYEHAKTLLEKEHAYVCICDPEEFRELLNKKQACPCRALKASEQLERWNHMLNDWPEGKAVMRVKTDIKHKNPAVRDWPAFRIIESEHPRQGKKYRVWPLMNFAVAIDDHELNLTHVIHGKDHLTNAERQSYIYKYLNWWYPPHIHTGRINFQGIKISSTEFRNSIEEKKYTGWDDIRLPTLAAFKRRGLQAKAFIHYVHEVGPSKVDKTVTYEEFMKALYAFNRNIIEEEANRFFFVEDPIELELKNLPDNIKAEAPVHPDFPKRGMRSFKKNNVVLIEKKDLRKDGITRLMHFCNIENNEFISKDPDPKLKAKAVHWLPKEKELVKTKILTIDGKEIKGLAEAGITKLKEGDIIQFERKFFARFDHREKDYHVFYETHK